MHEAIERLVRDRLDDEAQHVHADVRVLLYGAGRVLERGGEHETARLARRVRVVRKVAPGRETRAMLEQLADGDARLLSAREGGKVARDGRVERDAMLVEEHHHGRGGGDDLGERGEIVERALGGDRRARRRVVERAVAAREHRRIATADDHRRAGKAGRRHSLLDHAIHRREALGGHPDAIGRARWKATGHAGGAEQCEDGDEHPRVTSAREGAQRSPSFVTASCRAPRLSSRERRRVPRECPSSDRPSRR